MKRTAWIFMAFLMILFSSPAEIALCQQFTLSGTSVPSSFHVPRGQSSLSGVVYQFTSSPPASTSLNSPSGSFLVGGNVIEVNPVPLSVNLQNGSGQVPEVIHTPVRVLERTLQSGTNRFSYSRIFGILTGNVTERTTVNFTITAEAAADFAIKRIGLYFENRRAEITVEKDFPNLKAFAEIRYVGSGLLQGFWEVDGRVLSHVNRHLTFAQSVTLETPGAPPLPTFDTGTHIVRFVITTPATEIPLPSILYFVTPTEFKGPLARIRLKSPEDGTLLDYSTVKFQWEGIDRSALFLTQFFDQPDARPIFSAYTRDSFYSLPEPVLKSIFSSGQKYYWRVKGFDTENSTIGESDVWSFSFKAPQAYVPGEIVAAFTKDPSSDGYLDEVKGKYKLEVVDTFSLASVNLRVVIFKTQEKDPFGVIDELRKDPRIFIAQPNFILRTLSDPLRKRQYAHDLLEVDKIHAHFKGKKAKIAVIDTGVDASHKDLRDRLVLTKNFVRGESYREEIHGTATAGIIAASINGFGIEGVAPEAGLLAMRTCQQASPKDPAGVCFTDSLAKALDEAIEQKVNIINISLGGHHYDPLLAKLIDKGVERGILFVAPAGNLKNEKDLSFPASYAPVISVGGVDERLQPYPNLEITKKAFVCAPAVNILTTVPDNKHNFLSGTSLSSAYITGLLALAFENGGGLNKQVLPAYQGNLCKWVEDLLQISICEK